MSHCDGKNLDAIGALNMDAKAFPGGVTALVGLIGRTAGVLHNKFSEADERYAVTDREADALALAIAARTGATGYIEAKCLAHGGLFVPLPEAGAAADDDVLSALLGSIQRLGDLARELTEARADGVITIDEFNVIDVKARRLQSAVAQSMQTLRSQVCELSVVAPLAVVA